MCPPQTSLSPVAAINHRSEAQQAVDELLSEHLIPFELRAEIVDAEDSEYTIRFFDSRLHSVTVLWEIGQSFKGLVRAAILDRVSRFGPFNRVTNSASGAVARP